MSNPLDELKADPWTFAASLHSPIGVYLRREVFKRKAEDDADLVRDLYEKTVADQLSDGSWDQLFVATANSLWNLALLGYNAKNSSVKKGLEWLLSIQRCEYRGYPGFFHSGNRRDAREMRSTFYGEFGPGCTIFYQTAYAAHLFHLFGFDDNQRVQTTVKSYLHFWRPDWCGAWCTINVLRMLIEHPLSADSERVEKGIRALAKKQTRGGGWRGFPFYHTFHALSRAKHDLATKQVEKAYRSIVRRQNGDGSWGGAGRETETFLVLDGFKNVGVL
jgi:hypothetical protein